MFIKHLIAFIPEGKNLSGFFMDEDKGVSYPFDSIP